MQLDPALSAEWLEKLFVEKGVRKPGAAWTLSENAYKCLAGFVAYKAWRHSNPWKPTPESEALYDPSGKDAALLLIENLEKRLIFNARTISKIEEIAGYSAGKQQISILETVQRDITVCIESLRRLLSHLEPHASAKPQYTWRHHAVDLANDFLGRLRECNESSPMGISHASPVCTYIAAVAPFITGETPNPGNVATFLKDQRARIRTEW